MKAVNLQVSGPVGSEAGLKGGLTVVHSYDG